MVRSGSTKPVEGNHWLGRLNRARSFHQIARDAMMLTDKSADAAAILSNMILAAVGYADALTAAIDGVVNQNDHQAILKALRKALGNGLPAAQETHLRAMLSRKDEVQYGARYVRYLEAESMIGHLEAFAAFTLEELIRRFPERMRELRSLER